MGRNSTGRNSTQHKKRTNKRIIQRGGAPGIEDLCNLIKRRIKRLLCD